MDESAFWELIDASRPAKASQPDHLRRIQTRLRKLPPEDIAAFQRHLDAAMAKAQDHGLCAAAALIRGLITDDTFIYFCLWLISRGRAVYEAALANPDSLAGVVRRGGMRVCQFEELWGVAKDVYEKVTGSEMPRNDVRWPSKLSGEECNLDSESETRRRFPKLSAR